MLICEIPFFYHFLLRLFSHDLSMMSFLWCWYCNSEVFVAFLIQYFPSHILIRNTHAATHVHGLCTDTDTNIICIYASEKMRENARERKTNLIIFILFEFHSVLKSLPAKRIEREQKSIFFSFVNVKFILNWIIS